MTENWRAYFDNLVNENAQVLVAGAGGFIGGHLVATLIEMGFKNIVAADIKPVAEWYQRFPSIKEFTLDLSDPSACKEVVKNCTLVVNLAADMGGMGFIENNRAKCMLSVLINTHLLQESERAGVKRFFFSSSACVYAAGHQNDVEMPALREEFAYPAMPEDGYGWEKLFSERLCQNFYEDFGIETRIARYHNVYGPFGTFDGGREKAPAAMCRKIISAKASGNNEIEIWGDGSQTRSFMDIRDCIEGTLRLIASDTRTPINLGSAELVTINQLVDIIEDIAEIKVDRKYKLDAPLGVRGRNSDNTLILQELGWAPSIPLREGMKKTYDWICNQMVAHS